MVGGSDLSGKKTGVREDRHYDTKSRQAGSQAPINGRGSPVSDMSVIEQMKRWPTYLTSWARAAPWSCPGDCWLRPL